MKININAPITNNHIFNRMPSFCCKGWIYKATITLPNIDINVPKYLCIFFKRNI